MRIVDLDAETLPLFLCCLEDWSDEGREAGDRRGHWYARYKDRGLGAKLALDDRGVVGGMIQYLPIEHTFAVGEGLYLILCVWVHGHPQGRGDFQGHGMGTALLAAAEADARARGALGMAAWGLILPFWMRAGWFKKHGYRNAERQGLARLVWKPFSPEARPPRWLRPRRPVPRAPGRVAVTAFVNGWCMGQNLACERACRAAGEFGERVALTRIDTTDDATRADWGITDGVFVDGRAVRTGPPPSLDAIRHRIARRVRRLPASPGPAPGGGRADNPLEGP